MENNYYNFGSYVMEHVNFWDIEIEDGIDICLEILLEEKEKFGINYVDKMFSNNRLENGSKLLWDIKNGNYSLENVGKMVMEFFEKEM